MSTVSKWPISTRVNRKLWVLFRTECKARGIRVESGVEGALIAGLQKLGVEVPASLLEEDEVDGPRAVVGPSMNVV